MSCSFTVLCLGCHACAFLSEHCHCEMFEGIWDMSGSEKAGIFLLHTSEQTI